MALARRVFQCWLLLVALALVMALRTWHLIPGDDHHASAARAGLPKPLLPEQARTADASASDGGESSRRRVRPQTPLPSCTGASATAGATAEACAGQHCCWEVRNERVRAMFTNRPSLQWDAFEDLGADPGAVRAKPASLPVRGSALFELAAEGSTSRRQTSADCTVRSSAQPSRRSLELGLECGQALRAEFRAWLPTDASHYLRFRVRLWASGPSPRWNFTSLRLFTLNGEVKVTVPQTRGEFELRSELEPLDGLPIVVEDRFFAAVEHPMAVHRPSGTTEQEDRSLAAVKHVSSLWTGATGQITHLRALAQPNEASPWEYGGVFGTFSEESQARRAFVTYLHAERPGRRSLMVHYNSWYDFYSYQDEGFNGGFKDRFHRNETKIAALRKDKMSERSCLEKVETIGTELVVKRGTKVDSFLWDDGWDDPNSLWQFDKERFPRSFDPVSAKAKSFGVGTGVWLSPWGGYGFTQEARVAYGEKHGWETNWNERMGSKGFSLAGPNYRKAFHDVAMKMVREQSVNMFKFDGVAGDPRELAIEMEAMLQLIRDLRRTSSELHRRAAGASEGPGQEGRDRDEDDWLKIWINLTTGTWASPFFLLWADSIWRGGSDIASRPQDWFPDDIRFNRNASDGLSRRQRWIRWRNLITYVLVVRRSHFFPLSQLMIHGVILASHGDALFWGLDRFDDVDFAQEVWSFVALGLQLQELYVAPQRMTNTSWDILAEGLQWSRRESGVLLDSHWAFGDPTDRQVYCVASWSVAEAKGFVFLHNPTGVPQGAPPFALAPVLELPAAQAALALRVEVVKSISRYSFRESLFGCKLAGAVGGEGCLVRAAGQVNLTMLPTEVLVLSVVADRAAA